MTETRHSPATETPVHVRRHGQSSPVHSVEHQGALILDGGLATTLEDRGHDLDDPLWSARVLIDRPAAIGSVHADFLAAGADVITTATYQASAAGFAARGLDAARRPLA